MPFVRGYLEFVDQPSPPGGPSSGHPSHPIYWPGAHPEHPWIPPGPGQPPGSGHPSHPWIPPPGHASHPWVPPGGHPSHPIVEYPSHPIVIPPGETPPEPGNGLTPTHPIVIPPPASGEGETQKALVYAVVPGVGGVWFLIEVPVPPPPTEAQPKG
jgi:hypothetical protein